MTFAELTDRASLITWIDELLAEANPEHDFTFGAKDYKRLVRWQSRQAAYKVHTIQKRSGGERTIHVPGKRLKSVLSVLNHALQAELTGKHALAACVIGFVPGRSIVDGAREHCRRRFVFNTDLEDFFPSVELHRIKACLTLAPFNLKDARATQTTVRPRAGRAPPRRRRAHRHRAQREPCLRTRESIYSPDDGHAL